MSTATATMNTSKTKAIEVFNSLLRGELSAVATYDQAIAKIEKADGGDQLQRIRKDHVANRDTIVEHISNILGGTADTSSGAWGTFATAVEGTAKIFGNTAAIKALKEGEEHGINEYEEALEDSNLGNKCRTLISTKLLPPTRQHIGVLDSLMAAQ